MDKECWHFLEIWNMFLVARSNIVASGRGWNMGLFTIDI